MVADRQPNELGDLKKIISEFMSRYHNIENEIDLLREDQKNLIEEYEDKLDTKTLKQAIRIVRAKQKVKNKDTFDTFCDILESIE